MSYGSVFPGNVPLHLLFTAIIRTVRSPPAVLTSPDCSGQAPTQVSKRQNENKASAFLLCQGTPEAVCASFEKWVEVTRKGKNDQLMKVLIRHCRAWEKTRGFPTLVAGQSYPR